MKRIFTFTLCMITILTSFQVFAYKYAVCDLGQYFGQVYYTCCPAKDGWVINNIQQCTSEITNCCSTHNFVVSTKAYPPETLEQNCKNWNRNSKLYLY